MRYLCLTLAAILLSAGGVNGWAAQPSVPEPGVLRWGVYFEPSSIDPHAITEWAGMWVADNTYETLVRYGTAVDEEGKIVGTTEIIPWLAESWEVSPNGMVYTFYLRKGVKFHDGTDFNAYAVQYSINRMLKMNMGPARTIREYIDTESTVVVDDYTVEISLRQPCPFFLRLLAQINTGAIVSPAYVEAHGGVVEGEINEHMRRHECGTGPFVMGEWVPGERYELVANPEYWQGAPKLDKVIFKIIKDFSAQYLMLLRGELDIVYRLPPDMMEGLIGTPGIVVNRERGVGIHRLWINNEIPPFDNPLVRKALMYAIDPQEINEAAAFGFATLAKSFIPSTLEGFTDAFYYWGERDVAKAKELLEEAGYPDGFATQIYYNAGNTEREQTCLVIQKQLEEAGIKVEIMPLSWPTFVSYWQEGKMPLFVLSDLGAPIVDSFLLTNYHSKNKGPGGNYAFYENPEVDSLIDQLLLTLDPAQRNSIITEVQRVLAEDASSVPIYEALMFYAQRDWVQDWVLYPSGDWYFYPVWKGYK
ncbi:ABC transporter substrate-binding protein [Candidatus Bipolaricaulota bacterium]|nr:ABC transporter substrate-binding protein [Candidatus Bipolaricaulota bacterium]